MADLGVFSRYKSYNDYDAEQQKNNLTAALTKARIESVSGGGNLPAPVQVANEMFKYKALAEDETADPVMRKEAAARYNLLGQSAKTYGFDRGTEVNFPISSPGMSTPSTPIQQERIGTPEAAATVEELFGAGNTTGMNNAPPPTLRAALAESPAVGTIPGYAAATASIDAARTGAKEQAKSNVELDMKPKIKTAEKEAENIVAARDNYGKVEFNYKSGMNVLNKALASPGLDSNFGAQGLIPNMPGGKASDAAAIIDQIEGGAFLTAFETLKGGGQITQIEGEKATNAIVRAKRAQSADAFREALADYMDVMNTGLERARQAASGEVYDKWKNPSTAPVRAVSSLEAQAKAAFEANKGYSQTPSGIKYRVVK